MESLGNQAFSIFASPFFMRGFHAHGARMAAATPPSWPIFQARKGWKGSGNEQNRHSFSKLCLLGALSTGIYLHTSLAKTLR